VTTGLPLTGERTVPGIAREQYWFARHEVVYRWLAPRTSGLTVLEAGSGEGYGAQILHDCGAHVVALDYDETAIRHSAATYDIPHLQANLAALPVSAVNCVVSLQVIEHLWDLRGFLKEVRRVAQWTCLSTPNRLTFSPGLGRGEKPTNPFHVEEFDAEQLADLLAAAGLRDVVVHGLHHGPRITAWEAEHGSLVDRQVAAALGGSGDPALGAFVATITAEDFLVGDHDGAQDLIATAVAP
jgi:SAM-dependent methyltransferase